MVVLQYKVVSADYFWYKMSPIELDYCLRDLTHVNRPLWDAARIVSMFTVAPHMSKKVQIQKMFPLPWDHDGEHEDTEDEIQRQMEFMKQYAKTLNNAKKDEDNLSRQGT